ncbi:MAG: SET domain-containing protein-lysine N-methyltransferase [Acidimicrobiia bacterium]|nr:SET domain-containing protein-lysine N-methyltransferase [Acidimicrobiia bacterium]
MAEGERELAGWTLTDAVVVGTSKLHGRGVFAGRSIAVGERFCVNHLFRIASEEREFLDQTALYDHYFEFEDDAFIALGPVTFLNHADMPNADFRLDAELLEIALVALRPIVAHEEITIHYGTEPWW